MTSVFIAERERVRLESIGGAGWLEKFSPEIFFEKIEKSG
jgi:hypothetical protein